MREFKLSVLHRLPILAVLEAYLKHLGAGDDMYVQACQPSTTGVCRGCSRSFNICIEMQGVVKKGWMVCQSRLWEKGELAFRLDVFCYYPCLIKF